MGVEANVEFEGEDTLVIRSTEETALQGAALNPPGSLLRS